MGTRNIACAALFAACSIALVACDLSPSAPPSATPSQSQGNESGAASPSDSPSPSPSASKLYKPATAQSPAQNVPVPKFPELANENSENGAASFAEYYFDLINYLVESNDSAPLKKVTSRACEICGKSLIDPAARAQISGKWQVGGRHEFMVLDSYLSTKNKAAVSLIYSISEAEFYVEPDELDSKEEAVDSKRMTLSLQYDKGWKVQKIVLVEDRK